MNCIRGKFFFGVVFFLVVFLQGVMPFIHAHTGLSSVTGIHTPEVRTNKLVLKSVSSFKHVSKSSDESAAIQVGTAKANENTDLALSAVEFVTAFAYLVFKPTDTLLIARSTVFVDRTSFGFYSSESYPPPSLAPPSLSL